MTEIEALLSVDAGRVPPGVTAFFPRDPEAATRRMSIVLAIFAALLAVGLWFTGTGVGPVALLVLGTGVLGVSATRTLPEPEDRVTKRPTLLVSPDGIIMRDGYGLRTWHFDDLREVRPFYYQDRVGLLFVRKDGSRDFVDHLSFERGENLRDLIGKRVTPRQALGNG